MTRRMFTAALAAATAAALSASPGAKGDMCHLEWDLPCCPIPGSDLGMATVVFTICNCTDQSAQYEFVFKADEPTLSFDPPGGVVGLEPGECVDIPITVFCNFQQDQDGRGPFSANVVNLSTGNQFECGGSVRPANAAKVTPPDPVIDVSVDEEVVIPLVVQNLVNGPNVVDITASSMNPDLMIVQQPAPVQFDAPGMQMTSLTAMIVAPDMARGAADIEFYDCLLTYIATDGGNPDVNSSVTLRVGLPTCDADLNGDGQVGSGDLAALLGSWGPCP